jgi:VWFA-related protein
MRMTLTTAAWVAAAGLGLAAIQQAGPPAPAAQQPQVPTFRARVDSVSVDVLVTDRKGAPVTDLAPGDFEIRESGKVQAIETFKFISADPLDDAAATVRPILSMAEQEREAADDRNRLFVILLDDYHVRRGNDMRIRQELAEFVRELTPRDLVAVLYPLTPITAATFSRSHEGTADAIMKFVGRKYDYTPRNDFEERYQIQPPQVLEQMRNDLVMSALESACRYLGTLRDGRKTVLFVSEGLAGTLPPGVNLRGTNFPNQAIAGTSDSQAHFNQASILSRLQIVFTAAARANTAIYTLDPRGLAVSEFDIADNVMYDSDRRVLNEATDSLRTIADQTDGRAIVGRNEPLGELRQMARDSRAYYLLGYTSSLAPRDGKFHEIQVRVRRRDVDVRARKGYWAYTIEDIEKASAPARPGPPREVTTALDALAAAAEPASRRAVAVWLGATRGTAAKATVTLAWEAQPGPAGDAAEAADRVSVTAHTIQGEELFRGTVARDAQAVRPAGRLTFEAPPGTVRVRVTPETATGRRLEGDEVHYEVPDFTRVGPVLSPPMVFRGRTARDLQVLRSAPAPLPVAIRTFTRLERVLVRFDAYGPAGTVPAVTLRLLNRQGDPMATLPTPAPVGATFDLELGLGAFPPGDYLIEIAAKAGDDTARTLLALRIAGG